MNLNHMVFILKVYMYMNESA